MKRLFIGIDISDEARQIAAQRILELKESFHDVSVGWEKPEKLHITLKFLGRTEDSQLPKISKSIRQFARMRKPFRLTLTGHGVFPSLRNPRILWLGLNDIQQTLCTLAQSLIDEMAKLGFEPEKRQFKAHLTIARIKEPQKGAKLAETHSQMEYEPVEFRVGEIVLYESQLGPTGSVYTKLEQFQLGS
jgi:2'-5' RNA ligase